MCINVWPRSGIDSGTVESVCEVDFEPDKSWPRLLEYALMKYHLTWLFKK